MRQHITDKASCLVLFRFWLTEILYLFQGFEAHCLLHIAMCFTQSKKNKLGEEKN